MHCKTTSDALNETLAAGKLETELQTREDVEKIYLEYLKMDEDIRTIKLRCLLR